MWKGCSRRVSVALALCLSAGLPAVASDCNRNGVEDWLEIKGGALPDCNENGVPDPCDILPVNYLIAARGALPVGFSIGSVAPADLDGDGDLDLAMAHFGFNLASILWNVGGGRFSEPDHVDADVPTTGVALGDVDGDRRVDIVLATQTGLVLFINRGSRRFSRRLVEVAQVNRPLVTVLLADFDGDGRLDAAATAPFRILVFLNGPGGPFTNPVGIPIGSNPVALAAQRIDADADIDLVTANHLDSDPSGNVSILLNDGGGRFAAPRNFGVASGPTSVAAGDLNGDGKADIATACLIGGIVCVLLGTGDGGFTDGPAVKVPGFPNSVSMVDLDGDGDLDLSSSLIGQFGPGSIAVLLNHGDASFAKVLDFPAGFQPLSLFTGDLTGDGVPEVGAGLEVGTLLVLERIESAHDIDCDSSGVPDECELRANDCNNNGLLDTCDVASGQSLDCNANQKPDECESDCNSNDKPDDCDLTAGTSEDCNRNGFPDECDVGPSALRFETSDMKSSPNIVLQLQSDDLDRDGHVDAFGMQQGLSAVVFWNGPDGFEPPAHQGLGVPVNAVAAGDVEGDGDMDLIVGDGQFGRVLVLAQDKRSFGTGVPIVTGLFPVALSAADIDGDADVDVAVADGSNAMIQFFLNEGTGDFTSSGQLKPSLMPAFFLLADVDGDQKPDLITARQDTGFLGVFWNEAGRFDNVSDVAGRATPVFVSIRDIEGDGDLDVIGGVFDGFTIGVQETARSFRIVEITAPIQLPFGFRAEDLDGDRDTDIAAPTFTPNGKPALVLLRNRGDVSFEAPVIRQSQFFLGPMTSADYDGDRRVDLAASAQPFCIDANCVFEPRFAKFLNRTHIATSRDANGDHRPDECDTTVFRRGDTNGDGSLDVTDAVFTLRMLFGGGAAPSCAETADTDNDGTVSLSDPVLILDFLFRGGLPLAAPGPGACGPDPDPVGSQNALGCSSYDSC